MTTLTVRPSLLGRSVFDDIFLYRKDFNRLLKRTTEGYPVSDIYDDEHGCTVMEFALAGFTKDELSIEIKPEDRTITVSASSKSNGDNRRIARRSFQKTYVNYDNHLDLARAEADYKDGLLTIILPTRESAEAIKVNIA
jgi:HSP20 family molecular chaperone IbpA